MTQDEMKAYLDVRRWHFVNTEILEFDGDSEPYSRIDTLVRKSGEKRFVYTKRDGCRVEIDQKLAQKLVEIFTRPVELPG